MKKDIIDFVNWKAKALYFNDPDGNIIEFIGRERIDIKPKSRSFMQSEIINISEVGIATVGIENIYKKLNAMKEIHIFDGNFNSFCALGDDNGLFIVVNKYKKNWFPTGSKIEIADFIIKGDYNFSYQNGEIKAIYQQK